MCVKYNRMKNRLLLLLVVLHAIGLPAQNWIPVDSARQYNFRHSDSIQITHVVIIDSVRTGSDGAEWYYLNRVVADCDTCAEPVRLTNQGQFLQKIMIRHPDGRVEFRGKDPFVLIPQAPPGVSWLLDTLQNKMAEVVDAGLAITFGEADSIKLIAVSDGSQIWLSKEHGLIFFPDWLAGGYFTLVGIPTLGLGEAEPAWQNYFDFSPGDAPGGYMLQLSGATQVGLVRLIKY